MSDQHSRILAGMRRGIDQTQAKEHGMPFGTSHPSGVPTGYAQFRTDLGLIEYYDGTRWLTTHEYTAALNDYVFGVAAGAAYAGGVPQSFGRALTRTDYTLYITRFVLYATASVLQTAINNWRISFQSNFATTTNAQYNTNGQAAGVLTLTEIAVGSITQNGAASSETRFLVDVKNGAPGTLTLEAAMYYRLVIP